MFAETLFFSFYVIVALFQLSLALGAPWGEYTMGGRFPGQLPPKMRIAALIQIIILFALACIVLLKSGLAFGQFYPIGKIGIWFVVAFFVLGSILNLATPSKKRENTLGTREYSPSGNKYHYGTEFLEIVFAVNVPSRKH